MNITDQNILLLAGIIAIILAAVQILRNAQNPSTLVNDLSAWGVLVLGVGIAWAAL